MEKRSFRVGVGDIIGFANQKNWKQAVGFYVFYFIVISIVSALTAVLVALSMDALYSNTPSENFKNAAKIVGIIITFLGISIIDFAIMRNRLHDIKYLYLYVAISILAFPLAFIGGAMYGLIPLSFLTTRKL
jgi:hypothetical protein